MLLGPDGRPIEQFKKAPPPKMGPAFGDWAGRDAIWNQMPGGAMLGFDLSQLTLADFRAMKEHPQINASLSVLTFMMHQLDWWIECDKAEVKNKIDEMLRRTWTRMMRAFSQAYWAGYSPIALEYENNVPDRTIEITKFKDLTPEECQVNWKIVEGYAPPDRVKPKFKIYDGIKQYGGPGPIPVENSVWYPLLMENGNFYGKKLLKPAFTPWYFSILVHLFANRYYERFGEPTPIGRAPFDDQIQDGDQMVPAKTAMETILMNLRSRGVVVLPADRSQVGTSGASEYDWNIEYLESQMRGADFERYLSRLDEEMSLAIFTPMLLFRTGDVGSHNLGVQHAQMFLWMLNALAGDLKEYIDKYVVRRLKEFNWGPNAPEATWHYRKMGKENVETVRAVITELVRAGKASVDLDELGLMVGMSVKEVREVTQEEPDPNADPNADPNNPDPDKRGQRDKPGSDGPRGVGQPRATGRQISARLKSQVENAFKNNKFGQEFKPNLGYRRRFEESLKAEGLDGARAVRLTDEFYTRVNRCLDDWIKLGSDEYAGADDFMEMFDTMVETEIDRLLA